MQSIVQEDTTTSTMIQMLINMITVDSSKPTTTLLIIGMCLWTCNIAMLNT